MKSVSYLPDFLRDVEEFKQLCLIYDSFGDGAQENIDELVADETPDTATLDSLRRWAEIQGLTDYEGDDWETLRGKVILKFSEKASYTIIGFRQAVASIIGEDNFWLDMSTPFTVDVVVNAVLEGYEDSIVRICEIMMPMNVHYGITPHHSTEGTMYTGGTASFGQTYSFCGTTPPVSSNFVLYAGGAACTGQTYRFISEGVTDGL